MSHIVIDGYNLIGIQHKNLETARNDLIHRLHNYATIKGHQITLVFDGWKEGKLTETKTTAGKVTVIYSRLGETADHFIKKIISAASQSLIVVSSDKEIADFAERKNCAALTSGEFERKLLSAQNTDGDDKIKASSGYDKDEDDELISPPPKGRPKKASRSYKRKIAALGKL